MDYGFTKFKVDHNVRVEMVSNSYKYITLYKDYCIFFSNSSCAYILVNKIMTYWYTDACSTAAMEDIHTKTLRREIGHLSHLALFSHFILSK